MSVQMFNNEDRVYDGYSRGVLVLEESRLAAEEGDPIHVRYGDEDGEVDDYFVNCILPLRDEPGKPARVAVYFSESDYP